MNGISNYQYGAYNSPYTSSYQTEIQARNVTAQEPGRTAAGEAQSKSSGVASLLSSANTGRVTTTQSEKYGTVVGEPNLSEKAQQYYDSLKKKFGGMDFVLVSKDQISAAKAQAGSFGNPNKPVVLIDEEKLERMATDESFRKKYEGIISMSQSKLSQMGASLGNNPSILNYGMSVDKDGKTSFFATVKDTSKGQMERIEKKRSEKKAAEKQAQKQAEKKRTEERREAAIEKRREQRAPKTEDEEIERYRDRERFEPQTITANSMEDLLSKIQEHSYTHGLGDARAEAEKALGGSVDFSA